MSLSDCEKCGNIPCDCGYEYNHWDLEKLKKLYQIIGNIIASKEDRRKEEQKQLEEFKETTKGANQNGNAGETDADSGKEVEKFLKDFGHLS
jgi:hypothetical protein